MTQNPSYVASEDLLPRRFVMADPATPHGILQADAGADAIGVTQEGTRTAPLPGVVPVSALAGESVRIYGLGEVCEVEVGNTTGLVNGARVKSDADGKAVVAAVTDLSVGIMQADVTSTSAYARVQLEHVRMPAV